MRGLLDRLVYWLEEMTARYLRLETVVWREEGVRGPRNRRQRSENSGGGNADFFFCKPARCNLRDDHRYTAAWIIRLR